MGYCHRWARPTTITKTEFEAFARDVQAICKGAEEKGIDLAGPDGRAATEPEITGEIVALNGSDNQRRGKWTTSEPLGLVWPIPDAGIEDPDSDPAADVTEGVWAGGESIKAPVAPIASDGKAHGEYESFIIQRETPPSSVGVSRRTPADVRASFCKTNFRPYDIVVAACLIAFRQHVTGAVIGTDGGAAQWINSQILCWNRCGYGFDVEFCEGSVYEAFVD